MKRLVFVLVAFLLITVSMGVNALEPRHQSVIDKLVALFKQGDKQGIAKIIRYPLHRRTPIPSIKNADEFLERFDEVFDDTLISSILASDANDDWDDVGWRGITFYLSRCVKTFLAHCEV